MSEWLERYDKCRQSNDYYYGDTCTVHPFSYMDDPEQPCERARIEAAISLHTISLKYPDTCECCYEDYPCPTVKLLKGNSDE